METTYLPEITVRHFSFQRTGKENLHRRVEWARNYGMVLFRYLPLFTAILFSTRLLLSYILSGCKAFRFRVALLPVAMARGAVRGLRTRTLLSGAAADFYSDPATRPEIGNVSITSKVRTRVRQLLKQSV